MQFFGELTFMAVDSGKCCLGHWVEQFGPAGMHKLISNRSVQKLDFGALHPHGIRNVLISKELRVCRCC